MNKFILISILLLGVGLLLAVVVFVLVNTQ